MKAIASESNTEQTATVKKHQAAKYSKVLDRRNHPIRGLWQRGDRFYARMEAEDVTGKSAVRWFPLFTDENKECPCTTVKEAVDAFGHLKSDKQRGKLTKVGQTPLFADYVDDYFKHHEENQKAAEAKAAEGGKSKLVVKRASTLMRERGPLDLWKEHLAGLRLHKIRKQHIVSFIEKRQKAGMTGRTCNYDVIALRNVLKRALDTDIITDLPTKNLKPCEHETAKRGFTSAAEIDRLCEKALEVSKNGQQFSDYIRLMSYCGSRRDETLRLKWSDVDFAQKQIVIGSDGLAKNHKSRSVDFNPKLEAHLKDMKSRRAPDSEWLFPSPQRGEKDIPAKSFRETMELARTAAKLEHLGFHDCRHHFASFCVMSGVDFMTVSQWLGHQDGGILVAKVYAELANEHKKKMAQQVNFGPVVLQKTA